jgi:hypothetical protein
MNSALRFIRASIVSAPLVLALSCACPKVYLPTSDSTPPTIAWKVTNLVTGAVQTGTGNDTLTAKYNQRVDVKMTAADSGGVNEASLVSLVYCSCKEDEYPYEYPWYGTSSKSEKHDAWPSGQVCSKIVLFWNHGCVGCPDGYQFSNGWLVLTGEGKNFHGGVTKATLTITVTP